MFAFKSEKAEFFQDPRELHHAEDWTRYRRFGWHDPEKCEAVFRKDRAQTRSWS